MYYYLMAVQLMATFLVMKIYVWFVCVYVCTYVHVPAIVIVSPLSDPFDLSHNLGSVVAVKSECLQGCTVCCH